MDRENPRKKGQRFLPFSILKETPTPRQNGKIVFEQE
jgi:hypothetical protein